ncbi:MAG TPA: SgcJ/EcaC family oxidoreductase [Pyrinomonadaceae bacterium]
MKTTTLKRCSTYAMFMLVILGFTSSAQAQNGAAADEAALRDIVKTLETGWNTKSGATFAKPFAEDADYVVINGMYFKGRAAIESAHQRIFDTIYKDTNVNLTVKQVRFLRSDVAVVHVTGHRDGPAKELVHDAILTLVTTKEKEGWTIAAFQNTAIAARQ